MKAACVFDAAFTLSELTVGADHDGYRARQPRAAAAQPRSDRYPEFSDFFAPDREERFFVKNLETIQGDERDVIILSIG